MDLKLDNILEQVKEWCYFLGDYQLSKLKNGFKSNTKSTDTDMVTEVDKYCDKYICDKILSLYPTHSILSEEEGYKCKDSEYTWIIDPLDGTNNYVHNFPIFGISIALKKYNEIILGVVYFPRLNEIFTATKGNGAYLNEERIYVSKVINLHQSFIASGFPYDKHFSEHNNMNIAKNIIPIVQGFRRTGSAAFDICSVACGRLDGYWELKISEWDIAAGKLILKEAGGKFITSYLKKENGDEGINVICGNETISNILQNIINKVYNYF